MVQENQHKSCSFRIKSSESRSALSACVFFGMIMLGILIAIIFVILEQDPRVFQQVAFCLAGVGLFGFFFAIGLYGVAKYFRHRIIITDDEVVVQGVFKTKRFRFDEVSSVDWGKHVRWITAKFPDGKLRVHFREYSEDDFDRLVYLFRTEVPEERQENWDRLCYSYSYQGRTRSIELGPPDPAKGEVHTTRSRYDRLFVITAILLTILALVLFFGFGFEAKTSFPLILVSCFWLGFRFAIPKKGYVEQCIIRRSQQNKELSSLLLRMAPVLVLVALALIFQKFQVIFLIAAFFAMMVAGCSVDKERNRQQTEEIKRFAEKDNLRPERVFRWVDEGKKCEVELID